MKKVLKNLKIMFLITILISSFVFPLVGAVYYGLIGEYHISLIFVMTFVLLWMPTPTIYY